MNIAVIGSGISGLSAADNLAKEHQVTVFEASHKIGGHADTQLIELEAKQIAVDTGFIVFNPEHYPTFMEIIEKYGIYYKDSDMSFSVSNRLTGLEYNATSISQLFCQRKNLLNPKFYKMISDIFRFYREAKALLNTESDISLGDYLQKNQYSDIFINEHIIPMTCALWSGDTQTIFEFPARFLVAFMHNHQMMQVTNRPIWKTINNGSRQYLDAINEQCTFTIKRNTPIKSVIRENEQVILQTEHSQFKFDKVIFACHSNQALKILEKPSTHEIQVLGAIDYQENTVCLHRDIKVLPKNPKAWASWNVLLDENSSKHCTVSYYMNLLQSLETDVPVIVSLNMQEQLDQSKIWKTIKYHHPVYNKKTILAQNQRHLIQGQNHSYFCGAYWGWGFHEDGARSGKEAALQLLRDTANA